MFLILCGATIIAAWAYILFIREWLVANWPDRFGWWHQLEDTLWAKSRTLLIARLYTIGGIVVAIHDALASAGLDWTPLTTQITNAIGFIPENLRALALGLFLMLTGIAFEKLRQWTTGPIGGTEKPS